MSKMRILQINKLYFPETGGIERTVQNIAEGLSGTTDMEVLVCRRKGAGTKEKIHGVPICRAHSYGTFFSMPISLDFIFQLRRMSKDREILHFHMPFPLGDLACLLSGYQGKVVAYWHSDVVKQKKFMVLYRPIMKRFLKRADVIMVGAQGIMDGSLYLQPYRDKCVVVPFAVSREIWQAGDDYLRREDPVRKVQRRIQFLFVGRLVYYKGCSVLIEALKQVPNAELTMIGTGDLEASLKNLCQEFGVCEQVRFMGSVTDEQMAQQFQETDVLVLPSIMRSEAFGLVQLEAMAYGKPVINTNLPSGVPEVSLDGVTGLTVEPGDVDGLARAMAWMIEHPKEREALGKAAKKRLDENFTLERILPRIYKLYETLLGQ